MKWIVGLIAGVLGFLAAFSFTTRDQIAAGAKQRMDDDFIPHCTANLRLPAELQSKAPQICGCMKAEFKTRGLAITDAFGSRLGEVQEVTQACAQVYG